jgi:Peroxidase
MRRLQQSTFHRIPLSLKQQSERARAQVAGGPKIDMQYGRVDGNEDQIGDTSGLPAAAGPFPKDGPGGCPEGNAQGHLRAVFGRMGFTDQEMVALSGAHTLGRVYKHRSGATGALRSAPARTCVFCVWHPRMWVAAPPCMLPARCFTSL